VIAARSQKLRARRRRFRRASHRSSRLRTDTPSDSRFRRLCATRSGGARPHRLSDHRDIWRSPRIMRDFHFRYSFRQLCPSCVVRCIFLQKAFTTHIAVNKRQRPAAALKFQARSCVLLDGDSFLLPFLVCTEFGTSARGNSRTLSHILPIRTACGLSTLP
jgi:hypothetical protein